MAQKKQYNQDNTVSNWLMDYACNLPQMSGSKAVELCAIGIILLEISGKKWLNLLLASSTGLR